MELHQKCSEKLIHNRLRNRSYSADMVHTPLPKNENKVKKVMHSIVDYATAALLLGIWVWFFFVLPKSGR